MSATANGTTGHSNTNAMKSYLENKEKGLFWEIVFDPEEDCLVIRSGALNSEGAAEEIGYDEAMDRYMAPPGWAFGFLVKGKLKEGFAKVVDPVDLLRQVETAQEAILKGRIREFYETGEVLKYQDRYHKKFGFFVNFDSRYAKTVSTRSYSLNLVTVAGMVDEKGYEDEQMWIGINPDEGNSPVYELHTSSYFEEVFPDFDEFLKEFEAL